MQVIRWRDINGFLFSMDSTEKPQYIYCPQTDGLRCMELCDACVLNAGGDEQYKGVWCICEKRLNAPRYMNR